MLAYYTSRCISIQSDASNFCYYILFYKSNYSIYNDGMRSQFVLFALLLLGNWNVNNSSLYAQNTSQSSTSTSAARSASIPVPIKADAQTIFLSNPDHWRQKAFEVYHLTVGNNIIVIKFSSYAEQRKFFFRLTYFSNQDDTEHHIQPASYYDGMHSYNANDYNAEELADFFNQLAKQHMNPEPGEAVLLNMALSYKIIKKTNADYKPIGGAIISFSMETEIVQRKRYLVHETMHGLFYTVPKLREAIFATIEKLTPTEKYFWYLFLKHKGELDNRPGLSGYNINNKELVVNEIFAHVMQTEPEDMDDYFFTIYIPRMFKLLPEEKQFLENFLNTSSSMFYSLRSQFAQALEKYCGLKNGILF